MTHPDKQKRLNPNLVDADVFLLGVVERFKTEACFIPWASHFILLPLLPGKSQD
ncbi:hypothetical protein [uncultured Gimesia sp.]|uniref:hypothetical protein n=1 Tax=uncultured Gimesia sp. TaxID=1678688 RepID=UPI0030D9FC6F|tara:strand:- start:55150 stop:55311 length:162 start_codon:yes stop_codon:yes gene_type:complete